MAARWTCSCDHLNFALKITKTRGDEFDLRKFDPSTYGYHPDAVPDDVLHADPNCCPLVHVKDRVNLFNFALYADGACWGNGTPQTRASVGVYGTPAAWYNQGFVLPLSVPQTNQSAEIYSAIAALDVASAILKDRWDDEECPDQIFSRGSHVYSIVYLVMDSNYVVQAMTEWIRKWRANGFRNTRGAPVVNKEALQTLDDKVRRLFEDHLVIVRFWHVPRIHNFVADELAAEALRGYDVGNLELDYGLDELVARLGRDLFV